MSRGLLLGIDVGTTNAKAALYALDGEPVAEASVPCRVERPRDGWVEQDAEEIWRAAGEAVRGALASAGGEDRVAAIGVCGHSPTLILLDADGRPVRPAIIWQDRRAAAEAEEIRSRVPDEEMVGLLGGRLPFGPSFPHPRLLWLRRHEPEALGRARVALDTKDWVNFRLTGARCSDPWSAKGLANMQTGRPIAAWRDLLDVDPSIAPPTRSPAAACGRVAPAAAAALGLPAGVPVATGWTDGGCAMLGTGCFAAEATAYDVAGTSEVIGTVVPRPCQDGRFQNAPGPDPGWTLLMGPTQTSGAALLWAARLLGVEAGELARLAAQAAPGAGGVVFLPYLEGERAPIWDPDARGVLFGLATSHGRPEVARAVLEGVACAVRHVLETFEEATGRRLRSLRVCGGGAREPLWNQIKADLTGRRVQALASPETAATGAAMLAAVAGGLAPSLDAAASSLVRLGSAYDPDIRLAGTYDATFATYVALYPRLRDLFSAHHKGVRSQ
jgi:xylulokinase